MMIRLHAGIDDTIAFETEVTLNYTTIDTSTQPRSPTMPYSYRTNQRTEISYCNISLTIVESSGIHQSPPDSPRYQQYLR